MQLLRDLLPPLFVVVPSVLLDALKPDPLGSTWPPFVWVLLTLLCHLVNNDVLRDYAIWGAYMVPWYYVCWTATATELWLTSVQLLHYGLVAINSTGQWSGNPPSNGSRDALISTSSL